MTKFALALAALVIGSAPVLANDFSGNLVFPTSQNETTKSTKMDLDRTSTHSIEKSGDRNTVRADDAQ